MSYQISLSSKAKKQYKKFDRQIQVKTKDTLSGLKETPYEGLTLTGKYAYLRYIKTNFRSVDYRIVYDISEDEKLVLVIFLGTRENFYKKLSRYLR